MDPQVDQSQHAAAHFPGDQYPTMAQGYYGAKPRLSRSPPRQNNMTMNEGNNGPYTTEGSVTLRILLNSKGAGVVIGKAGKTVEEMREFSGAKAGVSKSVEGVNDRILTISGTIEETSKAIRFLSNTLVATPCMTFQNPIPPTHTLIRLLVPNAVMGSVIGRSGQRIKQIQEMNGVRLIAAKESLPNSTERLTDISGLPEGIEGAVRDIAQCLLEEWERVAASTVLYDPRVRQRGGNHLSHSHLSSNHVPGLSSHGLPTNASAGSHTHPLGGPAHQNLGMNSLNPQAAGMNTMGGLSSGPYMRAPFHYAANQMMNSIPAMSLAPAAPGGPGMSHALPRYPHVGPRLRASHQDRQEYIPKSDDPNAITQTIAIPSDMVGCIIGKGGSRIGAIREHSGSKISVSKAPNPTGERIFTIVGTRVQNDLALKMLYEQLAEEKERRLKLEQQHGLPQEASYETAAL